MRLEGRVGGGTTLNTSSTAHASPRPAMRRDRSFLPCSAEVILFFLPLRRRSLNEDFGLSLVLKPELISRVAIVCTMEMTHATVNVPHKINCPWMKMTSRANSTKRQNTGHSLNWNVTYPNIYHHFMNVDLGEPEKRGLHVKASRIVLTQY
jgi:hypothetical protein